MMLLLTLIRLWIRATKSLLRFADDTRRKINLWTYRWPRLQQAFAKSLAFTEPPNQLMAMLAEMEATLVQIETPTTKETLPDDPTK